MKSQSGSHISGDLVISGHMLHSQAGDPSKNKECFKVVGTQPWKSGLGQHIEPSPEERVDRLRIQMKSSS